MNITNRRNIAALAFIAGALAMGGTPKAFAQANVEVFGQNRVQYRKFDWRVFETKHFRIYHYDAAGRQLARYVAEQVENDIKIIERRMGGEFPNRMNIMVYNSYDEYRQTNIGRKYDSQLADVPAGTINIIGDKMAVYFTGVHTDLRRQTRLGMVRVIMERMMFGESVREMVKNAVQMNLPQWTIDGFLAYMVDGWDTKANSDWKNLIAAYPEKGYHELSEMKPELAGKAFWKFVSDKYGEGTMKTLLYNMQMKGSLPQGIKLTLNQKVKEAYASVIDFYSNSYAADARRRTMPADSNALIDIDVPKDNKAIIRNVRVAPKGGDVAYVEWKNGEFKIYLQKTADEQNRSLILEGGRPDFNEAPDPDYPLMAWSNDGYRLAIVFKKGKQTRLRIYNSIKGQIQNYIIPPNRFDRVLGVSFLEDDTKLLFSAIKKSQTDLYEFTIRGSRMVNITNDAWDDVQPWYVSGGSRKGILFLSNRPEANLDVPIDVNELPTGPMNVFFYNTTTRRRELVQMSNVTAGSVSQPIQYGSDNYAYLYDVNGIRNKYVVMMGRNRFNMDSAYAVPITDYPQNIVSHQYNPSSNQVADVVQDGDKFHVYFSELKLPGVNAAQTNPQPTILQQSEGRKRGNLPATEAATGAQPGRPLAPVAKEAPVLKRGNIFRSEFKDDTVSAATAVNIANEPTPQAPVVLLEQNGDTVLVDSTFVKLKAQPYKLSFKPDFFTVRLDNSVLFNRYQSVAQNGGQYSNPSLGGMITVSLDDKMEDHRFTGGFRLPINFSGTTYFLQYENFKRRRDWGVLFLRNENFYNYLVDYKDQTGQTVLINEQLGKTITTMVQGSVSYPLDRMRSLRAHVGLREDKLNFKAQDTLSLSYEPENRKQYWGLSRFEYVFDNSIRPALNIYNGFRYKFFMEYLYRLNKPNGGFYNFGVDARYYKKIYKNSIVAIRGASAVSGGNQKILYYLGGVDNWINNRFSDYVPVRPTENYAFQALATNLRGYAQNARNGNSYAVVNAEVRVPIFTTLFNRPIQSSLVKNFQLVGFIDAGSAWNGFLPNADQLRNNNVLSINPGSGTSVTVIIEDQMGGLAVGYGGGIRTSFLGYFFRADMGWNIDGLKPVLHLSIGSDF